VKRPREMSIRWMDFSGMVSTGLEREEQKCQSGKRIPSDKGLSCYRKHFDCSESKRRVACIKRLTASSLDVADCDCLDTNFWISPRRVAGCDSSSCGRNLDLSVCCVRLCQVLH
jgi:hypothetical protein